MRILLVNNTPSFLAKFKSHLQNPHYQIEIAANSEEGLQCIRKTPTDVVISNIEETAKVDNLEFMLNIKELKPGLPVILITHQFVDSNPQNMIQAGAYACIDESISGDELIKLAQRATKDRIYA